MIRKMIDATTLMVVVDKGKPEVVKESYIFYLLGHLFVRREVKVELNSGT